MVTNFVAGKGVYQGITYGSGGNLQTGTSGVHFIYRFDASKSNSIYKENCNTVQPPTLQQTFQFKF